jgi:uncharacterized membrane protein YdjX (TVP38/TMEM64 family)
MDIQMVKLKKILVAIVLLALVGLGIFLGQTGVVNTDNITQVIQSSGMYAWVVFIIIYIVATVAFVPGTIFTLAGGYLFGPALGFGLVMVGATLGALMAYLASKYFFYDYFHKRLAHTRFLKWSKIEDQKKLFYLVLTTRLIPIFPFNLLNYGLGMTKVKPLTYTVASFIGMLPATFIYVFLGSSLNEILSFKFLAALGLIVLFSSIIYFVKKKTKLKTNGTSSDI